MNGIPSMNSDPGLARVTRLAPSPTGHMHLGHAWSFLIAWCLARRSGWRIVLRLEDLDTQRAHREAEADVRWMLEWLGIDWDGEAVRQSERMTWHVECMRVLEAKGVVFEAPQSRAELRALRPDVRDPLSQRDVASNAGVADGADAPHEGDDVLRFPESLRPPRDRWRFTDRALNHRLALDVGDECVHDEVCGTSAFDPHAIWGDPLIWLKAGSASYQLAVVADDIAQGVTDVIRGNDLLPSAALQQRLHALLARQSTPPPRWWHLPLVRDATGKRLAKRHDALSVAGLAERGATADRVRGAVAFWLGTIETPCDITREELLEIDMERTIRTLSARTAVCRVDGSLEAWLVAR